MATDYSSRPKPPVLKRFANLDIDGVEKPSRQERRAPSQSAPAPVRTAPPPPLVAERAAPPRPPRREDPDLRDFDKLADELNDNARVSRETTRVSYSRFNAPMPDTPGSMSRSQRAAELRRQRGLDPSLPPMAFERQMPEPPRVPAPRPAPTPPRRSPIVSELGVNANLWDRPRAARVDDAPSMNGFPDFEAMTPGVVTVEVDLARRPTRRGERFAEVEPQAGPLELTPLAARQIQLMAWEAGVPNSALRILTSPGPGLGWPEIDFAFDDKAEPDDTVFMCHGVTILIDPQSLRWVAGRRISWHDVPGSEGFGVG